MIQSMTGYGKSVTQLSDKKITIEIKSLNSKQLDLSVRMPSFYKEKEMGIRKQLGKRMIRGKIEFLFYSELTGVEKSRIINKEVARSYIDDLKEIAPTDNEVELLQIAMRMPDATTSSHDELDEEEWLLIQDTVDKAIDNIVQFRTDEGKSIEIDFKERIANIESLLEEVKQYENERIEHLKMRIKERLEEVVGKAHVDENRFEQELIYYIEKLDINEEKVRLKNHLNYFIEQLDTTESNGKKLGFITQEIGREINTLGSKSNHTEMQKIVIQMKDELEKIKEQVLNSL
ncbi:MAG: YicC/YloC family endoribonuclease [Flavobacteriales bacterium]